MTRDLIRLLAPLVLIAACGGGEEEPVPTLQTGTYAVTEAKVGALDDCLGLDFYLPPRNMYIGVAGGEAIIDLTSETGDSPAQYIHHATLEGRSIVSTGPAVFPGGALCPLTFSREVNGTVTGDNEAVLRVSEELTGDPADADCAGSMYLPSCTSEYLLTVKLIEALPAP